ncbi:MAG: hypothetical protein HY048_17920 [Acidobacteria bacterium]|nr:hypothetical protein [Acidobacteriota bacterium]
MKNVFRALLGVGALLIVCSGAFAQSLTYSSGQTVAPAYEGWEVAADGAKYFLFGYMNRNWDEELDIPVGPDNNFNVGGADQGQATHFLPRRNRFVFSVKVPAGFTEKDELIWTLTSRGKTIKAYASLRLDYAVDDVVRASETGALGAGTSSPEVRANKAPVVKVEGSKTRTVRAGEPMTIVAYLLDDGVPKRRASGLAGAAVSNEGSRRDTAATAEAPGAENPVRVNRAMLPPARSTVGKNVGLHLSWFVYRGAGAVTFNPPQIKVWEDTRTGANSPWAPVWSAPDVPTDGRVAAEVTFSEPGTYVLRGLVDDGALTGSEDLTVTVVGPARTPQDR